MNNNDQELDELVRDLTAVRLMPKSEVRSKLIAWKNRQVVEELVKVTTYAYMLHENADYPKSIERHIENRINELKEGTS